MMCSGYLYNTSTQSRKSTYQEWGVVLYLQYTSKVCMSCCMNSYDSFIMKTSISILSMHLFIHLSSILALFSFPYFHSSSCFLKYLFVFLIQYLQGLGAASSMINHTTDFYRRAVARKMSRVSTLLIY